MPVLETAKPVIKETPADLVDDQVPAATYETD
jgi:hypothetical protein